MYMMYIFAGSPPPVDLCWCYWWCNCVQNFLWIGMG